MAQLGDTIIKGDLEVLGDCNIQGTLGLTGLLNLFYPVGSYYETSDINFDPNISWGGTWVQDTVGRCTVGANTNEDPGVTKNGLVNLSVNGMTGEATHTLSANEIPEFSFITNHVAMGEHICKGLKNVKTTFKENLAKDGYSYEGAQGKVEGYGQQYDLGGGRSHNNTQPSIGVVRWHRTA